jgi:2,3-bisphosphoglycerate-independent phosphoglycerate mutase
MSGFAEANSKTAQGYTALDASSLAVGLPEGLMGNSEVGHLNIGAGRVVWQDSVRIDLTLKNGELNKVGNIVKAFTRAKEGNGRLHLCGLVSDGGVHSNITHLFGLLEVAKEMQIPKVFIHFYGDGRDTDPKSAGIYMEQLLNKTKELGVGEIATVVGRYYIMDRDKRWERVEVGMKGMITGEGEDSSDPLQTIKERYEKGETDEFFQPIIVGGKERRVQGTISKVNITGSTTMQKLTWQQMTIPSSSSTTVRTVFVRLPSSWVTTTAPLARTSPTPRTSPLPP